MNTLFAAAIVILIFLILVFIANSSYGRGVQNTQEENRQVES